ncbi:uncharacterized protein LOC132794893 [Drosophila nasuta]|uniref:uncharacterized protein LOC132794893 n=1 Tax=Drosophila nasuta TaxID=42062 RepID=UPI00295EF0D8|nr:uncharacterized protein LOC132794893 [Drosophila nasuta]
MANTGLAVSSQASSPGQQHSKLHLLSDVNSSGVSGCDSNSTSSALTLAPRQLHSHSTALEQYRLQLYNYALNLERLRCPQYGSGTTTGSGASLGVNSTTTMPPWLHTYTPALHCGQRLATLSTISLFPQSQRIFQPEEPKPQHSYIGLIAMAILSSTDIKLVLSDIYQYILDNYPYFRTRGPGWRNSIRHNLSLNDCFIKSGRSANGKGHYWAIHPANMDDFRKGDFRRRKAQRKVRKHMGLSVDDTSTDSPSPPPLDLTAPPPLGTAQASLQLAALNYPYNQHYIGQFFGRNSHPQYTTTTTALQRQQIHIQQHPDSNIFPTLDPISYQQQKQQQQHQHIAYINSTTTTTIANLYSQTQRKRQFDVASLLAPDVQIVDIVKDERERASTTQTQHTVITKLQVQNQQTIHHHHQELVMEQPSNSIGKPNLSLDADIDADIDVDGDGECDGNRDKDRGEVQKALMHPNGHHLSSHEAIEMLSVPDDNNSDISDARRSSPFDADDLEPEPHNFATSISPTLGGGRSSIASSSQNDSNSLEECITVSTAGSASVPTSISHHLSTPLGMPSCHHVVDPHILSRYYGTYMAAAAHRASIEASRAQSKSLATLPPPTELLPNKL